MTLLEAAKKGAEWMRWWIERVECDCDNGHSCGRTERRQELAQMERAIKIEEAAEHMSSLPRICSLCGRQDSDVTTPMYKVSHAGLLCHNCDRE